MLLCKCDRIDSFGWPFGSRPYPFAHDLKELWSWKLIGGWNPKILGLSKYHLVATSKPNDCQQRQAEMQRLSPTGHQMCLVSWHAVHHMHRKCPNVGKHRETMPQKIMTLNCPEHRLFTKHSQHFPGPSWTGTSHDSCVPRMGADAVGPETCHSRPGRQRGSVMGA